MTGIHICPIHKCYLIDSSVIISGKASPSLKTAEEMITSAAMPVFSENEIEIRVAEYMAAVFQADIDMDSTAKVGAFLHSKMANTKYRSTRGEQRNIPLFHADFTEFYRNLPANWFTELCQIQKVLTDDRINFFEICLIALFLNIPTNELVHMKLPEKSQQELFDEEVYRLHEQGVKYPEIAKVLNASYVTVKAIGERRYGTYHKPPNPPLKSGAKPQDWQQIDNNTLPLVKDSIKQLQGNESTRPKRITVSTIEKILHLSNKTISLHLPKYLAEIKKHKESQEQYWAREVAWAANQLRVASAPFVWRKIREITNMRRKNFEACLSYIYNYTDEDTAYQLRKL